MKRFNVGSKVKIPADNVLSYKNILAKDLLLIKQAKRMGRDYLYIKHRKQTDGYVKLGLYWMGDARIEGYDNPTGVFSELDIELYNEKTIKMKKFKKGDRVVPHAKTVGVDFSVEHNWEKAKDRGFLYITEECDIYTKPAYYCCYENKPLGGNAYAEDDLSLYEEPKAPSIMYTKEYLGENDIFVTIHSKEEGEELEKLGIRIIGNYTYLGMNGGHTIYPKGGTFAHLDFYKTNTPYSRGIFITAQEVIDSHKQIKTETMSKAKGFTVEGKTSLLKAFMEDLVALGYKQSGNILPTDTKISINVANPSIETKERFLEVASHTVKHGVGEWNSFTLPAQYTEALEFAKAQLDEKLWTPQYKVGDVVTVVNLSEGGDIKVGDVGKIVPNTMNFGKDVIFNVKFSNFSGHYSPSVFRLATPAEIKEFTTPKEEIIKIGNNNLEVRIGKGKLVSRTKTTIEQVKSVYNYFKKVEAIGEYNVNIVKSERVIIIGCIGENNRVSLDDLKLVIDTYAKYNK